MIGVAMHMMTVGVGVQVLPGKLQGVLVGAALPANA
jgi:hypothetical protein